MSAATIRSYDRTVRTMRTLPLFVFLAISTAALGQSDDAAPKPESVQREFPSLPAVRPNPVAGFDDDASYIRSIRERVDELASRADKSDDHAAKVELLLAAVNLILAQQLEPHCTRTILQIPAADEAGSSKAIAEALDRADRLLADAGESIRAVHAPAEDEPQNPTPDAAARLSRIASVLRAFADTQRAYLSGDDTADSTAQRRRAASALAPLLEDSDKQIASSARLWQAALRALDDDSAPALNILEPALVDPPPGSLPYAFFSRLLRCRLIAARGGSAIALAMLTQIEERANDWFTDAQRRADATRAGAFLRLQVVRNWYERLAPADKSDERAWCVSEAGRINDRYFKSVVTVLRLAPAVPLLALPPNAAPAKTEPDAKPD